MDNQLRCHRCKKVGHFARDCTSMLPPADGAYPHGAGFGGRGVGHGARGGSAPQHRQRSGSFAPAYCAPNKAVHAPGGGAKPAKYPAKYPSQKAPKRVPPPAAGALRSEAWNFLDEVYLLTDDDADLNAKLSQKLANNSAVQMAAALNGAEANELLPDADRIEKFIPVLRNLFAITDKLLQPNSAIGDIISPEAQQALRALATTTSRSPLWKQLLVDVPAKMAQSKAAHTAVNHWVHICRTLQQRIPGAVHDSLMAFVQELLPNTPDTARWAAPLRDLQARLNVQEEDRRAKQAQRDAEERKRAADRDAARDEANRGPRDAPSRVKASILPTAEELATPSNAALRGITRMPSGVEVASVDWLLDVLSQQIREDFMLPLRDGVSAQRDMLALGDRGFHSLSEEDRTSLKRRRMQVYAANNVAFTDHFPDKRHGLLFRFKAAQSTSKGAPVIDWRKRFKEGNLVLIWRVEQPKAKGKNKTVAPVPYMDQEKPFISGIVVRLPGPKGRSQGNPKFRPREPIDSGEFAVSFADIDNVDVSALQKFFERQPAAYHFVESKAFFVPTHRALIALRDCNANAIESLTGPLIRGEADAPRFLERKGELDLATAVLTKPRALPGGVAADGAAIIPIGQVDDTEACRRAKDVCEDWSLDTEKRLADAAAAANAAAAAGGRRQQQLHVVDETQREGLVRAFSHAIALIKGTPGTGKTFIGSKIVQLLSNNDLLSNGHPILVLTLTNHACDSFTADLLHYVDPKHIIRIGKASDDPAIRDNNINMAAKDRERYKIKGRQSVHKELESQEEQFSSAKYRLIESDMGAKNKVRDGDKRERNEVEMTRLKGVPVVWQRFLADSLARKKLERGEHLRVVRVLIGERKEARDRERQWFLVHREAQHRARLAKALNSYAHELRVMRQSAPVCSSIADPYAFEAGASSLAQARPSVAETQIRMNDIRAEVAEADARLRQQQQQHVVDALEQHFIDDWVAAGVVDATTADGLPASPLNNNNNNNNDDDDDDDDDSRDGAAAADDDDDNDEADGAALLQEYEDALDEDQRDLGGDGPDAAAPPLPGAPESMPAFFTTEDRTRILRWLEQRGPEQCRTRAHRVQAVKYLWDEMRAVAADALNEAARRYHVATLKLRRFSDNEDAAMLRDHRVIVGTTAGAMKFLPSLRAAGVRIIMVEEVGEVPEAHIVACITRSVEQLILIGDDRQLEPKLTDLRMERKGLGQSLMARVASLGIPHSTLTVQRRMHPDISAFVRNYYRRVEKVTIQDHPSTHSRTVIPGVRPECHFAFIDTPQIGAKEQLNPGLQSPENKKEADYVLLVAKYLLAFVEPQQIAVVTAYKAQLLHLLETAKKNNIPWSGRTEPGRVRFATVDDYQGEESDIVLLSLVRTDSLGFLKKENRACVALSRARRLCVVFGSKDLLLSAPRPNANRPTSQPSTATGGFFSAISQFFGGGSEDTAAAGTAEADAALPPNIHLWAEATKTCMAAGRLGATFPAFCANHNRRLDFDLGSFKNVVNGNMGCHGHLCNAALPCGHLCKQECHPALDAAHATTKCSEPCDRVGPQCTPPGKRHCNHPCVKRCHEDCGPCRVMIDHVIPACGDEEHAYSAECRTTANDALKPKCTKAVTRDLPCGHPLEALCHEWPRDGTGAVKLQHRCHIQCGAQLPCGHVCKANCHFGKEHPRCMATCENYERPCGHGAAPKYKCSEGPGACTDPCGMLLACAHGDPEHLCEGRCGHDEGEHRCAATITVRQPACKHTFKQKCASPPGTLPPRCKEPCDAKLACDHTCAGECGECAQATATLGCFAHVPCAEKRDCDLECGHTGVRACGGASMPCTKKCIRGCEHHKKGKSHKCGDCPLIPCKEPCPWQCDHHKCTKPCGSPCDRPACRERCALKLKCGHQCSGVCGERCPRLCLDCLRTPPDAEDAPRDADAAKPALPAELVPLVAELIDDEEIEGFVFRDEVPEDVDRANLRLVELPDCSHVFFVSEIERALLAPTKDQSGHLTTKLPTCPKCRTPVASRHVLFAGTALRQMEALNARVGQTQGSPIEKRRQWLAEQQQRVEGLINGAAPGTFGTAEPQLRRMLAELAVIMATIDGESVPEPPSELPQQGKSKKEAKKANKDRMRQYEERVKRYEDHLSAARAKVDSIIAAQTRHRIPVLTADNGLTVLQAVATECSLSAATVLARQRTNGQVETLATIDVDAVLGLTAGSQALIHLAAVASTATQDGTAPSAVTRGLKDCDFSAFLCKQSLGLSQRPPVVTAQRFGEYLEWLVLYVRLIAVLQRARQMHAAPKQQEMLMPSTPCAEIPAGLERWLDDQRVAALAFIRREGRKARRHGIDPFFIESDCARRRCGALQRFANGMHELGITGRWPRQTETQLAFHGTPAASVGVICCQGLDQARRSGQVFGSGEYFGAGMDISELYTKDANMLVVFSVLQCPQLTAATSEQGSLLVLNSPAARRNVQLALPIGVVVYGQVDTPGRCNSEFTKCVSPAPVTIPHVERLMRGCREATTHLLSPPATASAAAADDDEDADDNAATAAYEVKQHDDGHNRRWQQARRALETEVAEEEKRVEIVPASRAELAGITKALGLTSGHAFACPNGHIYFIADCGGAMTEGKCPDCGATVGGRDHRRRDDNAFAGDRFDDQARPAWN